MAGLEIADIIWVAVVSFLSTYQLAHFARLCGNARRKFKIEPPETSGPPEFLRTFRAQQNCVEFAPVFLPVLWLAAIFFHQVPAAIIGLLYIYGRHSYFRGYVDSAKKRVPGFYKCVMALQLLCTMVILGFIQAIATTYFNVNPKNILLEYLRPYMVLLLDYLRPYTKDLKAYMKIEL